MSRVDEAIRRALENAEAGPEKASPANEGSTQQTPADFSELSQEYFPLEMPDRRRSRAPASPFPAPLPEPTRVHAEGPRPVSAPQLDPEPSESSLIDRLDSKLAHKIVVDQKIMAVSREQYRRLAASLHHAQLAAGSVKVVMIASAVPGEGKTLTACNLALTLSESYQRSVLLIDADLRRPAVHGIFGIDNSSGLSEGLNAIPEKKLPVRQVSEKLAVLTAGNAISDPMAGLTSERMRRLLEEAREAFEWVIIDTPPVAFLSDANLLAAMVDLAVVVVKAGSTPFDLVQRAVDAIGRERTAGVVLNSVALGEMDPSGSSYYDQYYGARPEAVRNP